MPCRQIVALNLLLWFCKVMAGYDEVQIMAWLKLRCPMMPSFSMPDLNMDI